MKEEPWVPYGIPFENNKPSKCTQYLFIGNKSSNEKCSKYSFNMNVTISCSDHVYKVTETTLVKEFNLTCQENQSKLVLVGFASSVGQLLFSPISGFLSDRYGRKMILLLAIFGSSISVLLRSFSINYWMFIVLEIFGSGFSQSIYITLFVLNVEILCPDKRVLGITIISSAYAIGEVYLAIIAMYFPDFRLLLRILSIPGISLLTYYWLIPESIRWLLLQKRYEEVLKIILKIEKGVGMEISKNTLRPLMEYTAADNNQSNLSSEKKQLNVEECVKNETSEFKIILTTPYLLIRLLNLSFCWLVNCLVFNGLSLNAVSLAGNKYLNFGLIGLFEIPGYILNNLLIDKLGRKWCICISIIISGSVCILTNFLSNYPIVMLSLCILGKITITISFSALCVYTMELYPTSLRQTVTSICATFSKIGLLMAPLTSFLAIYNEFLPYLLFGSSAILSGLFLICLPDTTNVKLPDTMEEAQNIGKISK